MSSKDLTPPGLGEWFLKRFLPEEEYWERLGDFEEGYKQRALKQTVFIAGFWYFVQVLLVLPVVIKNSLLNNLIFIRNTLKITFRNMIKRKIYTIINIIGLSTGFVCTLLIFLYIKDELSYDRFFDNCENIYRAYMSVNWGEEKFSASGTPPPVARIISEDYPEILYAVRIYHPGEFIIKNDENIFSEKSLLAVDENFFDVFNFDFIEGSPQTALKEINSIVLTRSSAEKYFDNDSVVGRILKTGEPEKSLIITGVVEDPGKNSHFDFDFLVPMPNFPIVERFDWSWIWLQLSTYVVLKEGTDYKSLQKKLPEMSHKYAAPVLERFLGYPYEELIRTGGYWNVKLQPLKDIHLYSSDIGNRLGSLSDIKYLYIFGITGLIIILIAGINYVNLTTARYTDPAKETGIKRVLGLNRNNLIKQFLVESCSFSLASMLMAVLVIKLIINPFNNFNDKAILFEPFSNPQIFVILIITTMITGLAAGIYPAFFLTASSLSRVLKGVSGSFIGKNRLRSCLVVFQFAVSTVMIIMTITVFGQLDYMKNKDLGFNKDNLLIIKNADRLGSNLEAFKNSISNLSNIKSVSISSNIPTRSFFEDFFIPESNNGKSYEMGFTITDCEFIPTLGIRLKAGRNFAKISGSDRTGIIINEKAVERFNWENPIGKKIIYYGGNNIELTVIGVIEDVSWYSLKFEDKPYGIILREAEALDLQMKFITVRMKFRTDFEESIRNLASAWRSHTEEAPLEYAFIDEEVGNQYNSFNRLGRLLGFFTTLAIFIACIGLLGLSIFSSEQRKREAGIRKTLGASAIRLTGNFTSDYVKLIIIANLTAWPIAYLIISKWLESFYYRIPIDPMLFTSSTVISIFIGIVTVGLIAFNTANKNPADTLRNE